MEANLSGFKVELPLTPEARQRVEKIHKALDKTRSLLPKLGFFMGREDFGVIDQGMLELWMLLGDLLAASNAAAGTNLPTRRR